MAKVTAPLLAFAATGKIADTLVYGDWRGVKYARQHVVPANPRTTAQTTTRTTFATLREMWKRAPALLRAPWQAYAAGRKFLGLNAFIGENLRVVRGDANFEDFIGSPGADGGLNIASIAAVGGAASGEIDVTLGAPSLPANWTITRGVAVAFPDQLPTAVFPGPFVIGEDATDPYVITLAGLPANTLCVVAGWFEFAKPDGSAAYSASLTTTATSTT